MTMMKKTNLSKLGKEKAQHVVDFITRYTTHTKGKWAGQAFTILPWQLDIIHSFFGVLRESDHLRQHRFCYIEIGKKNGKTELLAALALYFLCADGEMGAEVYSAASDREQAGLCYHVAAQMVRNNKRLSERLTIVDSRKRIVDFQTGSFYQVLSAETYTKHGINPSAILFDELHAQPNDELYNVLTSGTDYARAQQAIFITTTAGVFDPNSIWWRTRERAIKIRDGVLDDPTFLPVLYIADKDKDDPEDEKTWLLANPSVGHIFTMDKIREDFKIAKQSPTEYNNFLRFRLNIPVSSISRWIMPETWDACTGVVDAELLTGRTCYGGLDLSSTTDVSAFVLVFPPEEGEKYQIICRFWIPRDSMEARSRRDRVPYDIWCTQGHMVATTGNVIDYSFIINEISVLSEKYNIAEICYDRWGATKIMQDLQELGFDAEDSPHASRKLIQFGQGFASMSRPMKALEKMLLAGEINHGNNPVLRWMASNVVVRQDPAGNIKPDKEKSIERIDGVVALVMGLDRATIKDVYSSVYEEKEIERF